MKFSRGKQELPFNCVIYGVPGVGKSTWASKANDVAFIDLEGGLKYIDALKSDQIKTFNEFFEAFDIAKNSEEIKTIAIDSLSELEEIVREEACAREGISNIAKGDYGSGYVAFKDLWNKTIKYILEVQEQGKNLICIAHATIVKYEEPHQESYDRYNIKLDKRTLPKTIEGFDNILFAHYETAVKKKDNSKTLKGITSGKRIVETREHPAWIAKSRANLDSTIELTEEIFKHL